MWLSDVGFHISASHIWDVSSFICHFSASHILNMSFLSRSSSQISRCRLLISGHLNISTCHKSDFLFSTSQLVTSPYVLKSTSAWVAMSLSYFSPCPQVMMSMIHYVIMSLLLISSSHWVLDSLCRYLTSPHLLISVSAWVWSQIPTSLEVKSPHVDYWNVLRQTEIWETEKWYLRSDLLRSVNQARPECRPGAGRRAGRGPEGGASSNV